MIKNYKLIKNISRLNSYVYQNTRFYTADRRSQKSISGYLSTKYGIGLKQAETICREFGYLPTTPFNKISTEKINFLDRYTQDNQSLTRENRIKNIAKKVKIGSTQGIRRRLGRPVRGQRTHTNASTAQKLNKNRVSSQI